MRWLRSALLLVVVGAAGCTFDMGSYVTNVWPMPDGKLVIKRCHIKGAGMSGISYQDECRYDVQKPGLPDGVRRALAEQRAQDQEGSEQ